MKSFPNFTRRYLISQTYCVILATFSVIMEDNKVQFKNSYNLVNHILGIHEWGEVWRTLRSEPFNHQELSAMLMRGAVEGGEQTNECEKANKLLRE